MDYFGLSGLPWITFAVSCGSKIIRIFIHSAFVQIPEHSLCADLCAGDTAGGEARPGPHPPEADGLWGLTETDQAIIPVNSNSIPNKQFGEKDTVL